MVICIIGMNPVCFATSKAKAGREGERGGRWGQMGGGSAEGRYLPTGRHMKGPMAGGRQTGNR